MAEKIASLLDDDELCRQVSARAVRRAQAFSWENTAVKIRRIFRTMIAADTGRPERTS